MGIEPVLNAIWLILGLAALAAISARPVRERSFSLCCIGVALIVATLFPIISATDDVIRIQTLNSTSTSSTRSQQSDNHKRSTDNLIRLYEAMDSPLAVTPVRVVFTLFFAFLVTPLCDVYSCRRSVVQGGRSPPALDA